MTFCSFATSVQETMTLAQSGGVNLDVDGSVFVQILLFSVLALVLKPLLFDPLLRLFEERERRTEGVKQEARALDDHSERLLLRYEAILQESKNQAMIEQALHLEAAREKERILLEEAREKVSCLVSQSHQQIQQESETTQAYLRRTTDSMTHTLLHHLLGRPIQKP